ncbi:NAD(P)-dependent oxidoreductase [Streptomyces sp. DvalAA-19]|uniref:NAD(P)-dependent oxidoreductase n=1 Tax=Streptomyces sp. DvalAA-19 TaxID=1839761 RepID=UPI00081B98E0|nr:NAD(P)-dependent oxidoreductase [Streptomyces sp. DvalAA-19]SCD55013.1 Phosphoglycerate dehydrogenase [Streptomyces sp. DvalAA-19]
MPAPELLARARLLVAPGLSASLVGELERITGRGAEPLEAGGTADGRLLTADGPLLCVGAALPDALRTDRLFWFHSVNAGTDPLLAAGPWPAGALLTRTVGRMGERIAQYVLGWVLAECQAVPEYVAQHARAEWRRLPTELVAGQTALVYGTGRIGGAVAGLLRSCGVRTVGVGRTARSGAAPAGFDRVIGAGAGPGVEAGAGVKAGLGVEAEAGAEAEELAGARWVVAALPLTGATEGFFGAGRFAAMRGATFVNVGRGATVDPVALEGALRSGGVRRAVLDVLPEEPAAPGEPVWRLPRTVVTSHSAGITADEDVAQDFAACWEAVAAGRRPELTVDTGRGY